MKTTIYTRRPVVQNCFAEKEDWFFDRIANNDSE
jgi:hypothetical protein